MTGRNPSPHRRGAGRRRQPPVAATTAPAWHEWLVGIVALAIGAGAAVFGVADLYGWIDALHRDAPVIRTGSAMFALPLFGVGFLSIAVLGPLLRIAKGQWERWVEAAFGVFLASVLLGIASMIAGPIVVGTVMTHHHHACKTRAGFRAMYVTWARDGRPCPA